MTSNIVSTAPAYFIGCDLGQARDWTALCVAEQSRPHVSDAPASYGIRFLERWHPHRYGEVITRVDAIVQKLRTPVHIYRADQFVETVRPKVVVVVDRTGVGRAVGDQFSDAGLDCHLELVTITSGDQVARDGGNLRVPKRDLAGVVAVLLQSDRLRIAQEAAHAATLRDELRNFRVKISAGGHDSYGAGDDWREGAHDDLVLAAALALWAGEDGRGGEFVPLPAETLSLLQAMYDGEPIGAGQLNWR